MKLPSSRFILGALLALCAAVASFAITSASRSRAQPAPATSPAEIVAADAVADWLGADTKQRVELRELDRLFPVDLKRLRAELTNRRADLAGALDRSETTDDEIRAKSEAVIAASAALERRITDHLLSIRPHLSADQQRKLFGLCAEGLRQGRGWQWLHGMGGGGGAGAGGGGRGMGFGRGAGRGGPPASRP